MSYMDRDPRTKRHTGKWVAEVTLVRDAEVRFRRRCDTETEADGYEAYVRVTGQEPVTP